MDNHVNSPSQQKTSLQYASQLFIRSSNFPNRKRCPIIQIMHQDPKSKKQRPPWIPKANLKTQHQQTQTPHHHSNPNPLPKDYLNLYPAFPFPPVSHCHTFTNIVHSVPPARVLSPPPVISIREYPSFIPKNCVPQCKKKDNETSRIIDRYERKEQQRQAIVLQLRAENQKLQQENQHLRRQNDLLFDKLNSKKGRLEKINKLMAPRHYLQQSSTYVDTETDTMNEEFRLNRVKSSSEFCRKHARNQNWKAKQREPRLINCCHNCVHTVMTRRDNQPVEYLGRDSHRHRNDNITERNNFSLTTPRFLGKKGPSVSNLRERLGSSREEDLNERIMKLKVQNSLLKDLTFY